jgi:alpha,alpha-trehalase
MAGTVDLLQRCYTGLELRGGELWFNPSLPHAVLRLSFQIRYRRHLLQVDIEPAALSVASDPGSAEPITVRLKDRTCVVRPGERARFAP